MKRISLVLVAFGGMAQANPPDTPHGTYSLRQHANRSRITANGKQLPTCATDTLDDYVERHQLDVDYASNAIRVNGHAWVFDGVTGFVPGVCERCLGTAHPMDLPVGIDVSLMFWRRPDGGAGAWLQLLRTDDQGVPICATSRGFAGTYQ